MPDQITIRGARTHNLKGIDDEGNYVVQDKDYLGYP